LKNQAGGDMIAYGGADFVSSLIKHDLVDEYNLFINPVTLGDGMAIFKELDSKKELVLKESIGFPCGIVVIKYN
jgi:dihydrofolate reductase